MKEEIDLEKQDEYKKIVLEKLKEVNGGKYDDVIDPSTCPFFNGAILGYCFMEDAPYLTFKNCKDCCFNNGRPQGIILL